jgi:putative FmdB family regulatory protein
MPTYEYECKSCGHNFEVFQAMSDEPLKTCVKCGKEVRRLIFGGAGVIFKGSGFYVTDKGKGTTPAAGKAAAPIGKAGEPTGKADAPVGKAGGAETKPESKVAKTASGAPSPPAAASA